MLLSYFWLFHSSPIIYCLYVKLSFCSITCVTVHIFNYKYSYWVQIFLFIDMKHIRFKLLHFSKASFVPLAQHCNLEKTLSTHFLIPIGILGFFLTKQKSLVYHPHQILIYIFLNQYKASISLFCSCCAVIREFGTCCFVPQI